LTVKDASVWRDFPFRLSDAAGAGFMVLAPRQQFEVQ
jgi:hypothetical protein